MKRGIVIFATFILWVMVASFIGFYSSIRPFKFNSDINPSNYNIKHEDIHFMTNDNIRLAGWFVPSSKQDAKTIIVLHGYPADKGDILPSRILLHDEFNLLFFDFRHFGSSEGLYTTIGKNEVNDLLAAVNYLQTKGINEVGVWGFSFGAAVALMAAPLSPAIKAVVAESSYARLDWMAHDRFKIPILKNILGELMRGWGVIFLQLDIKTVSPMISVEKLQIPILLTHSRQDEVIPFYHAEALEKALQHDKQLEVIYYDNARHGEVFDQYIDRIRAFFSKNI